MDLDSEELEATKNMQSYAEKTADEMFEELGYKKDIEYKFEIEYKKNDVYINFDKTKKEFSKGIEFDNYYGEKTVTMQELQAINKKCKEMGWLDG